MEQSILNMKLLLQVLQDQVTWLQIAIGKTHKTAELALVLTTTIKDTANLQSDQEVMKHKIMTLEMDAEQQKLKLYGLPEHNEKSLGKKIFIAQWLVSVLNLHHNAILILQKQCNLVPL